MLSSPSFIHPSLTLVTSSSWIQLGNRFLPFGCSFPTTRYLSLLHLTNMQQQSSIILFSHIGFTRRVRRRRITVAGGGSIRRENRGYWEGRRCHCAGWNEEGTWLAARVDDDDSTTPSSALYSLPLFWPLHLRSSSHPQLYPHRSLSGTRPLSLTPSHQISLLVILKSHPSQSSSSWS